VPTDNCRQRQQEAGAPMRGGGESHASSGQTKDGSTTRDRGSAMRCNATTSRQGKREVEVLADNRWRHTNRASADAMQAGGNNDDKSSGQQIKNCLKESVCVDLGTGYRGPFLQ
jgi:hypothetical protein